MYLEFGYPIARCVCEVDKLAVDRVCFCCAPSLFFEALDSGVVVYRRSRSGDFASGGAAGGTIVRFAWSVASRNQRMLRLPWANGAGSAAEFSQFE